MSCMPDMTSTSFAATVVPRTKSLKSASMFLKEKKICYKMVYYIHFSVNSEFQLSQSSEIVLQS